LFSLIPSLLITRFLDRHEELSAARLPWGWLAGGANGRADLG